MPRRSGHWIAVVRITLVVILAVDVAVTDFPPGYRAWAWGVVGFFAIAAVLSARLARIELARAARIRARALAIALDAAVVIGVFAVFSFQSAQSYRSLYLLPIAEAALRFGLFGGLVAALAMDAATVIVDALGPGLAWRSAAVRVIVGLSAGVIVGRLERRPRQ